MVNSYYIPFLVTPDHYQVRGYQVRDNIKGIITDIDYIKKAYSYNFNFVQNITQVKVNLFKDFNQFNIMRNLVEDPKIPAVGKIGLYLKKIIKEIKNHF